MYLVWVVPHQLSSIACAKSRPAGSCSITEWHQVQTSRLTVRHYCDTARATVTDNTLTVELKNTINALYTIQSSVHGYAGPETEQVLLREARGLIDSLATLQSLARRNPRNSNDPSYEPNDPSTSSLPAQLPPEVIEYVNSGRNPDIYTREFSELVTRGNAYLRGRSLALSSLAGMLSEEIQKEWPDMGPVCEEIFNNRTTGQS
jgi:mediator of RNA polymerase II transcription subunit 10